MIDPTNADKGRKVIYRSDVINAPDEPGIIYRVTDVFVFVRFYSKSQSALRLDPTPQGCSRKNLRWADHA